MDFEIEGDEDSFDWNTAASNLQKKKSTFFGGGQANDEEDGYNFAYEKSETRNSKKYEPFSPVGQKVESKGKDAPKNVVASSQDAMERAQSMLNRYSNKSLAAPASNFRNQKIRKFNEDEMSMSSSDGAPSDFEMSESNEDFNHKTMPGKSKKQPDINALGSKAHVVVSMGDEEDDYSTEQGDITASPPAPLKKQVTKFSDEMEDRSQASEYSDEQFDADENSVEESADEVGESRLSRTVDTEPEDSVSHSHSHHSSSGAGEDSRSRSRLSESYSPGENNASYSRLVYGNEDEDDEVDSEHSDVEASHSSKPKVLSFADLLSQSSWDADRIQAVTEPAPVTVVAPNPVRVPVAAVDEPAFVSERLPITSSVTHVQSLSRTQTVPAAKPVAAAEDSSPVLRVPALTHSPPRSTHPASAPAPTTQLSSAPAAVAVAPHPAPSVAPAAAHYAAPWQGGAAPVPAPAGFNGYPPVIDPSAAPQSSYPPAPAQTSYGGPPVAHPAGPYGQYYPYPPPPPPPYYGYYPYPPAHGFAPPPPAHAAGAPAAPFGLPGYGQQHPYHPDYFAQSPGYGPWGREPAANLHGSRSSFPAPLSVDPRASYLGRSRTDPLQSISAFDRDVSQQPLVLDLLHELRKSKEEADWAKRKLAETIVRLGDNSRGSVSPAREREPASRGSTVSARANAASDVLSPVQPVRSTLRFSNPVVSAPAAAAPQSKSAQAVPSRPAPSSRHEDEVSDEEEEYAYDSDFDEDSPAKPSAKGAKPVVAMNHSDSYSYSFDDGALEENKGDDDRAAPTMVSVSASAPKTAVASDPSVRSRQLDEYAEHDFTHAAPLDPASQLRDRAKVLNPVRESLAQSLLASQELFKSQLESLRARINATNTYTDLMQQRLNTQWDELNSSAPTGNRDANGEAQRLAREALLFDGLNRTSFTPAPTLRVVQSQFESQRASSAEKLLDLLAQVYPNMTVAEARRLVEKF